jgi:hypothetical protein
MIGPGIGQRLFASTYSETNQAARSQSSEAWQEDLLGRIRLDALAFKKIVLPVDYIIDGTFFLSVEPSEFLTSVSRVREAARSPLEIRSTDLSLAAALQTSYVRGARRGCGKAGPGLASLGRPD